MTTEELAAAILATKKVRYSEPFTLPVSGLRVCVRSLTEKERAAYDSAEITGSESEREERVKDRMRRFITLVTCNPENKEVLFTPTSVSFLEDVDSADTTEIWSQGWRHVGARKPLEEVRKNSEATDGGGSP